GFRAAFALGVRSFELDVGMTADEVVVVHHDLALNPTITRGAHGWLHGPGPLIWHMTRDALNSYDVGRIRSGTAYWLLHRMQTPSDGARLPELASVLAAVPDARFVIELKTDPTRPDATAAPARMADAVLAVVDSANAATRVVIESFDWRGSL